MAVGQARHHQAACSINPSGMRAGLGQHLIIAPDGLDASGRAGHCLRPRLPGIDRIDACIVNDQVCVHTTSLYPYVYIEPVIRPSRANPKRMSL